MCSVVAVETTPNWLEEQRAEREPEFAPPQMYNETAPKSNTRGKNKRKPQSRWEGKQSWREKSAPDSVEAVIGEGISAIRAGMEGREVQDGNVSSIPLPPQSRDDGDTRESETPMGSDPETRVPPWSQMDLPAQGWGPAAVAYSDPPCMPPYTAGTALPMPPYSGGIAMPSPSYYAGYDMPPPPCRADTGIPIPPCQPDIHLPVPPYHIGIDTSVPPPNDATWMTSQAVPIPAQIDTTLQDVVTCLPGNDALGSTATGELTATSIQQPLEAAPQPAHYTSAPKKPQPKQGHYERVNMHQVPMSLPVPPIIGQEVKYPSMESVFGKTPARREEDGINYWKRQYGASQPKGGAAASKIPFPAPNIQKKTSTTGDSAIADFDLSKPPPNMKKQD